MSISEFCIADSIRERYRLFIDHCAAPADEYRLTPRSEPTPFALCFAIFGLHLIQDREALRSRRDVWDARLRESLADQRRARAQVARIERDKPYLQLLTFTASALAILGTLDRDPLGDAVREVLPKDVSAELATAGCLRGEARSGNHAMFLGILLLHARDRLACDTQPQIDRWVAAHLESMNRFGFWGSTSSMSHRQFQNGYHQYELLEYLDAPAVPWRTAANAVASLADELGQFAPYPGGGGCYDYDAVFVLTADAAAHRDLLRRTAQSLHAAMNADGGFGESRFVRPRSAANLLRTARHVCRGRGAARLERLRMGLTLLRPIHDRVHTHWSAYSREWHESNLWDSWFRMLALARCEVAFDPASAKRWGFVDYPGIGYHPVLRLKDTH